MGRIRRQRVLQLGPPKRSATRETSASSRSRAQASARSSARSAEIRELEAGRDEGGGKGVAELFGDLEDGTSGHVAADPDPLVEEAEGDVRRGAAVSHDLRGTVDLAVA